MTEIGNVKNFQPATNVSPQFKAQGTGISAPVGYMPDAQVKSAASGMIGMAALGAIGVAGIAIGLRSRGKVRDIKKQLENMKAERDLVQKKLDDVLAKKKAKAAKGESCKKLKTWFKNLGTKIKGIFKRGEKPVEPPKPETPTTPPKPEPPTTPPKPETT